MVDKINGGRSSMPEMKKFLDSLSTFQWVLLIFLFSFLVIFGLVFCILPIVSGAPVFMLILPVGLFAAIGTFLFRSFRKSLHAYDKWWNSLTDAEQAEIEQDFREAIQVSPYLIAGSRYAFIRQIGRAIAYDQIESFDFRHSPERANCILLILLKDARKVAVNLPSVSLAEDLRADLLSYQVLMSRTH